MRGSASSPREELLDLCVSPLDPEAHVFIPSENSLIHYPQDNPCVSPAPHELGMVSLLPEASVSHQGTFPMTPDCVMPSSASSDIDEELTERTTPPCDHSEAHLERLDEIDAHINNINDMLNHYMKTVK